MRIETKELTIDIEPELLTDDHIAKVKVLLETALDYERRRAKQKLQRVVQIKQATSRPKKSPKT